MAAIIIVLVVLVALALVLLPGAIGAQKRHAEQTALLAFRNINRGRHVKISRVAAHRA